MSGASPGHCVSPAYGCAVRLIPFWIPRDSDPSPRCAARANASLQRRNRPQYPELCSPPPSSLPTPKCRGGRRFVPGGGGWGSPCPSCRSAAPRCTRRFSPPHRSPRVAKRGRSPPPPPRPFSLAVIVCVPPPRFPPLGAALLCLSSMVRAWQRCAPGTPQEIPLSKPCFDLVK